MTEETPEPPEESMPEISRKITSNRTLIVLGVVVAILVITNIWTYTALQGQVDGLKGQVADLETEKSNLQSQVENLTDIVNLDKSTVIVNNQTVGYSGSYTFWKFSAEYAGYLIVDVHSSNTPNTYIQVLYTSYTVVFDQKISVGTGGTAGFSILPAANIEVRVGTNNPIPEAEVRVTVTYHY